MSKKYFTLGNNDSNGLVNIIRIVFGAVCIAVAVFWTIFNIRSMKLNGTLWITIIFLTGFGFYQVWSGLGRATRFIEIDNDSIRIKRNPILSPVGMNAGQIEKIEILPLNLIFFLKTKKRILLRFGTTYYETNQMIIDEILKFAEVNNIPSEIIEEKI